ncbi:permease [Paenibacillus cremeus]|uniref:Permease n=1 Tax=Paenibacillus cremeus TaxID=2163881 RepID=A0A559KE76_9BACL|nr:permease [Paenibacillus cremeus]TVY10437.1 permease [Paenibacillus cremeus]
MNGIPVIILRLYEEGILLHNLAIEKKTIQWNSNVLAAVSLLFILTVYLFSTGAPGMLVNSPKLLLFKAMFISIMIEAMPFILIGVVISALLQVFVSEQTIQKVIPSHSVLGIITASVLGIIFPICECGMVPAIRRLLEKGMPLYVATTFIAVGPILNPIVFWSTFTAFRNRPEIAFSRMGLAFLVALVIGLIVYKFVTTDQLKASQSRTIQPEVKRTPHKQHSHHEHAHEHGDDHKSKSKLMEVMEHAISEFFEMGKFLMFGSLLVALLQAFVPKTSLSELGHGAGSAHLLMMGLGFILSLCSTSDAFVAQSFLTTFSKGSIIAFMVFGPMLNLKGVLMMTAVFRTRFVVLYSVLVFTFVLTGAWILDGLI